MANSGTILSGRSRRPVRQTKLQETCGQLEELAHALGPDASVDGGVYQDYPKNFRQSFHLPHSNELSVKFIYYIDYLQLKRKSSTY